MTRRERTGSAGSAWVRITGAGLKGSRNAQQENPHVRNVMPRGNKLKHVLNVGIVMHGVTSPKGLRNAQKQRLENLMQTTKKVGQLGR